MFSILQPLFYFDSLCVEDFCELLSANEKKKKRQTGLSVRMVESTPDAESLNTNTQIH